jgi:hypothetical protein
MLRWLSVLFGLFLIVSLSAKAQENAELLGNVTDQTGAVVANATVNLTNSATGETRTGATNGAGLYDFPALHIGTYSLKVTAPGFQAYESSGIVMNVGATVREDVKLAVGSSSTTVTVQANALHLQTDTNEVSNLITGAQLTQLATNGRNMVSLTTLGTGVSNNLNSFNGVTAQGSGFGLSFNGMRPDHNNWLIDGGEAYDRGSGGKFDLMPSPDVLAEFQTLSSNYSPDYGINSGGTITMALKSGTKDFHGAAWEFNRNDMFDAVNHFASRTQPVPERRLNIFGGGAGGPVFIPGLYPRSKSRTFFYWSEEWRRYIAGATPAVTNTIPEANFPALGADLKYQPWNELTADKLADGVCANGVAAPCVPVTSDPKYVGNGYVFDPANPAAPAGGLYHTYGLTPGTPFPGNKIPAALIDQNAVRWLSTGAIPKPNIGTTQFSSSPKQPTFVREDTVRIDHDITDRLHLMGHWIHDSMTQTIFPTMWSGDSYSTVGNVFQNPSWASVIKLTQTISPTLLNETALNVNGNTININPTGIYQQPEGYSAGSFFAGNNPMNRLPTLAFGGPLGTNWTEIYWPWHNAFLDYQVRDDLSWTRGRHGLKFGFSYMRMDKNQQLQADTEGDYTFGTDFSGDSYLNFLLGFADRYQQLQNQTTPHWINNTYSFYGMDNWHLTSRMTLNLGMRYDALPHVMEKSNRVSNFVPGSFTASDAQLPDASTGAMNPAGAGFKTAYGVTYYANGIELAGANGYPRGVVNTDYFTWQPRLGFAYDMFGTGRTILRAGAGMFYERVQGNDIYGAGVNQPFAYQPSANSVYFSDPKTNAKTGATATTPVFPANITNLARYYPAPGTVQYSLGIQQELAPAIVGVIQYVGSGGWNQADQRNINPVPLNDLTHRQAVAAGASANLYRTFPGFAVINQEENASNSAYNSMQVALRMENKRGLTAQFAYTYGHEIDIASGDLGSTNFAGGNNWVSNPFDLKYDRGSGVLDRRHIFTANYVYNVPFFEHGNTLQREVLGSWVLSGVTVAQTGAPRQVSYSPDVLGFGGNAQNRPNLAGKVSGSKTQQSWFNKSAFAAPTAEWAGGGNHGFGTAGKDAIVGPGLQNWNLSLFKTFPITEAGPKIELRFESFNTFNHTQFNGLDTSFTDSNFGQVTSSLDPRVLQFGGKFIF